MNPSPDPSEILAEALAAPTSVPALPPEQQEALAPLLAAAAELRALPEATPSAEFRRTARARLLQKLPARPVERLNGVTPLAVFRSLWQNLFQSRRTTMRWMLTTLLVVGILGSGTVAYASDSALPGEPLYGMKRWLEATRLALTPNQNDAASLRLNLAGRRLNEATVLTQRQQLVAAAGALTEYSATLEGTLDSLRVIETRRAALLRRELEFQAAQLENLGATPELQESLETARLGWSQAALLVEEAGGPLPGPTARHTPTPTVSPTGTPVPTQAWTNKPTLALTLPPTENWIVNCVPQPWPTSVVAPTGLPTCAPGTPPGWPTAWATGSRTPLPVRWPTDLPATLTALPTDLSATLTALPTHLPATITPRPPIPTQIQATLTALPTSLPATLTALPTHFALPSDIPATLTALPGNIAGTVTALPPLPTLILPPLPTPRP